MIRPMSFEEGQSVKNSQLWEKVVMELDYRIGMYEKQLRTCGPNDFMNLQTKISVLDELKRLPTDVCEREEASVPERPHTAS